MADKVEGTDIGGLVTSIDNHIVAITGSDKGVHGVRFNGNKLELSIPDGKTLFCKIIEEEGESGIWYYIKYADGTAECWGTTQALADCSTLLGSWFCDMSTAVYEKYLFEFSEPPSCNYTITGLSGELYSGCNQLERKRQMEIIFTGENEMGNLI